MLKIHILHYLDHALTIRFRVTRFSISRIPCLNFLQAASLLFGVVAETFGMRQTCLQLGATAFHSITEFCL